MAFLSYCPFKFFISITVLSNRTLLVLSRVHNMSREGECLTLYILYKCTVSSNTSKLSYTLARNHG